MYRLAEPLANVASIGKGRKREMNEEKLGKVGESRCTIEDPCFRVKSYIATSDDRLRRHTTWPLTHYVKIGKEYLLV